MTKIKPKDTKADRTKRRTGPKKPKKITSDYLHNSGLYYLQRYAASRAHFRSVMLRKVKRSCMAHPEQSYEECAVLVDELVERFAATGLLNDDLYTRGMVVSLRRSGKSRRDILRRLKAKGLSEDLIVITIDEVDSEHHSDQGNAEWQAALKLARKRKVGPYARPGDETNVQKALGAFARAGFSYELARRVLDLKEEDLELTQSF